MAEHELGGAGQGGPQVRFFTPIVTLMNLRACVEGQQLGFGRHMHAHLPWHKDLGHWSWSPFLLIQSHDVYITPQRSSRLLHTFGWKKDHKLEQMGIGCFIKV